MRLRHLVWLPGFALLALLGYWLARSAVPDPSANPSAPATTERIRHPDEPVFPRFRLQTRGPSKHIDAEALLAGAIAGERILMFPDAAAMERFLAAAGQSVVVLDRLAELHGLHVRLGDPDALAGLLEHDTEQTMVFPVFVSPPADGSVQPGAVAVGNRLLEWLGITRDNSSWGRGVKIAVLDTGVVSHTAFQRRPDTIDLISQDPGNTPANGHGTAVASVIAGNDAFTPGVAPAADILSVRIAGDDGFSNSFLLAKGIIAAVDAGASIINISMGSSGDSLIVRNAIKYAGESGAMIVAAAGNQGIDRLTYPAAHEGVVAVGAVDAAGNHLDFSNTNAQLAISAPGFGINTAWLDNQAASVTGTSFSAPVISGAIAAVMTESGRKLSAADAYQLLVSHLNDAGEAGPDASFGAGMPDLGRVLNADTPGIHDGALASQRLLPADSNHPNGQVEVLVQNRGTETLINTAVAIQIAGGNTTVNVTSLAPNAVRAIRVPIPRPGTPGSVPLLVESRVTLSGEIPDAKPSNDRRKETYVVADDPP